MKSRGSWHADPQTLQCLQINSVNFYDAVVFDCDGVLLDSNDLKIEAFRRVLQAATFEPSVIAKFSETQTRSFGTSRYQLFDRLLSGEFGSVPADVTKPILLKAFSRAVSFGYLHVNETEGMRALITEWSSIIPLFVISGSEENELNDVFRIRNLDFAFLRILGSPTTKISNLFKVKAQLSEGGLDSPRLLFVGDAEADFEAARNHGADFLFVSRYSKVRDTMRRSGAGCEQFFEVETLADLLK